MDSALTGSLVSVKVAANNVMGSTISKATQFLLADVPGQPYPAPQVVQDQTTVSEIKVSFENENPEDGGSPLLNVELSMDDGNQGAFQVIMIASVSKTAFVVQNVLLGR